jgi:hypothetical protein
MTSREGPLRLQVLESLKLHGIKRVVARNFGEVQEVFSDAAYRMRFLQQYGPHRYVAHAYDEYVLDDAHINTIENAWSLFKRGLIGMYHHVSVKYLQEYLDEFAFRYSHRKEKNRLLDLVLAHCEV